MTFQLAGKAPQIYQQVLVPTWFDRWAEAMITEANIESGQHLLDLACGTGIVARRAKAAVGPEGQVDGLDINEGMLDLARSELADQDITLILGDASRIPRPDQYYDRVLCQHGYHYFPDKPAALAELERVLAAEGLLAVSMWAGHSAYTNALCDAVARHLSPEIAAQQRQQRITPPPEQTVEEFRRAGFSQIRVQRQELLIDAPPVAEFVPLHLGSMPIAAAYEALGSTGQRALITDVEQQLSAFCQGGRLIYPDAVDLFLATR